MRSGALCISPPGRSGAPSFAPKFREDAEMPCRVLLAEDHQIVRQGLRALLKKQAADDLVRAIQEVRRGAVYLSPGVAVGLVDAYLSKEEEPKDPLTARERQILQLVAEGMTTKAIGELLGITFKTAESHRNRIMKKLDIHQTAGLVRYAIRRGLVRP